MFQPPFPKEAILWVSRADLLLLHLAWPQLFPGEPQALLSQRLTLRVAAGDGFKEHSALEFRNCLRETFTELG